jgi:uncharacterized protein
MVSSSPPELALRPLGIPGERPIEIVTADGVTLDGRICTPEHARRAVVIAHPHPLYGGSMEDAVTVALTRVLHERGAATLRFDFRGVGRSEGRHHGTRETEDLLAAIGRFSLPVSVVGYSFGSFIALATARLHRAPIDRIALLSPALTILDYDMLPAGGARFERPIAIALGDRDRFANPARARVLAGRLGASIAVLSGEDHFFSRSRRRVAELLAPFLLGERERIDEGDLT